MWLLTTGHLSIQRLNRESRHIDEFGLKNSYQKWFRNHFFSKMIKLSPSNEKSVRRPLMTSLSNMPSKNRQKDNNYQKI